MIKSAWVMLLTISIAHSCNAIRRHTGFAMIAMQKQLIHRRTSQWQWLHPNKRLSTTSTTNHAIQPNRKRRGLIRSRLSSRSYDEEITQYTINDAICPPTNSTILHNTVKRHIDTLDKYLSSKPIAVYNQDAFEEALEFVEEFRGKQTDCKEKVKVILDSGCGTGKSTRMLGQMFEDCVVIGVDRSLVRLSKNKEYRTKHDNESTIQEPTQSNTAQSNILLLRADLVDFWHLCLTSTKWQHMVHVQKHYMLYPNPYPKKSRLKSRFYAHPAFPLLMCTIMGRDTLSDGLVIRSNWRGYLEEFAVAVQVWEEAQLSLAPVNSFVGDEVIDVKKIDVGDGALSWGIHGPERIDESNNVPMTNFEAKYFACGEPVYQLEIKPVNE